MSSEGKDERSTSPDFPLMSSFYATPHSFDPFKYMPWRPMGMVQETMASCGNGAGSRKRKSTTEEEEAIPLSPTEIKEQEALEDVEMLVSKLKHLRRDKMLEFCVAFDAPHTDSKSATKEEIAEWIRSRILTHTEKERVRAMEKWLEDAKRVLKMERVERIKTEHEAEEERCFSTKERQRLSERQKSVRPIYADMLAQLRPAQWLPLPQMPLVYRPGIMIQPFALATNFHALTPPARQRRCAKEPLTFPSTPSTFCTGACTLPDRAEAERRAIRWLLKWKPSVAGSVGQAPPDEGIGVGLLPVRLHVNDRMFNAATQLAVTHTWMRLHSMWMNSSALAVYHRQRGRVSEEDPPEVTALEKEADLPAIATLTLECTEQVQLGLDLNGLTQTQDSADKSRWCRCRHVLEPGDLVTLVVPPPILISPFCARLKVTNKSEQFVRVANDYILPFSSITSVSVGYSLAPSIVCSTEDEESRAPLTDHSSLHIFTHLSTLSQANAGGERLLHSRPPSTLFASSSCSSSSTTTGCPSTPGSSCSSAPAGKCCYNAVVDISIDHRVLGWLLVLRAEKSIANDNIRLLILCYLYDLDYEASIPEADNPVTGRRRRSRRKTLKTV